jgi:hypothetical protein
LSPAEKPSVGTKSETEIEQKHEFYEAQRCSFAASSPNAAFPLGRPAYAIIGAIGTPRGTLATAKNLGKHDLATAVRLNFPYAHSQCFILHDVLRERSLRRILQDHMPLWRLRLLPKNPFPEQVII